MVVMRMRVDACRVCRLALCGRRAEVGEVAAGSVYDSRTQRWCVAVGVEEGTPGARGGDGAGEKVYRCLSRLGVSVCAT